MSGISCFTNRSHLRVGNQVLESGVVLCELLWFPCWVGQSGVVGVLESGVCVLPERSCEGDVVWGVYMGVWFCVNWWSVMG